MKIITAANSKPIPVSILFSAHEQPMTVLTDYPDLADEVNNNSKLFIIEVAGSNNLKLICPDEKVYFFRSLKKACRPGESVHVSLGTFSESVVKVIFDLPYFYYCIYPLLPIRQWALALPEHDCSEVITVLGLENKLACLRLVQENNYSHPAILIRHLLHELSVDILTAALEASIKLPIVPLLNIVPSEHFSYYLEANFKKAWTVNGLANVMGKSLSSFKRFFLLIYQETPIQWLIDRRLAYAYHLYHHYNYSAETICLLSGFGEVTHFINSFKKQFGFSPRKPRD